MAISRLLSLPPELQTAIIDHVFRPEHLTQVSLVCKQLQRVALPLLYRDFSINVSEWSDDELERFLKRGHPGHQHIRSLDIDSEDLDDEEKALKVAKDVLQLLPKDCLRSFRCPLEEGIDNDLIILFAAQQRKLSSISVGPLRPNAFNLIDALQPWPPFVESIVVPWKLLSTLDFQFYHELIERSRLRARLKAMTIRTHDFEWLHEYPSKAAKAQACEELARGFFCHDDREKPYGRPPLQLTDINFQNQDLGAFGSTWRHYIDLTTLRTLQIWNCFRTDHALRSLLDYAKSAQPVRLEGLVLSFEHVIHSPTLTQNFLRSMSGLRYLNICYVPHLSHMDFDIRCLEGHTDTLRDLYLGIGSNDREDESVPPLWTPETKELQWLTSRCRKLTQLAVAMPSVEIEQALAGRWGIFLEHLILLAQLPRLKVLRILTWPIDDSPEHYTPPISASTVEDYRRRYIDQLDMVADSITRHFSEWRDEHHDRLSVLTFGNAEWADFAPLLKQGSIKMRKPVTYKVRRECGMLLKVVRIDPAEMKYEEPIAFVFDEDTDQGLSLESYTWGSAHGPR